MAHGSSLTQTRVSIQCDSIVPPRRKLGCAANSRRIARASTARLDCCITIRTVLIQHGKAYVQAGGGWVNDSAPEAEFQETVNKAKALLTEKTLGWTTKAGTLALTPALPPGRGRKDAAPRCFSLAHIVVHPAGSSVKPWPWPKTF
jgi:hypothetical protein